MPGPGTYDLSGGLSSGARPWRRGLVKSELDLLMAASKEVRTGCLPARLAAAFQGSPRFSSAGGLSLIEAIQVEARKTPGPAAYHPTPTFAEELATRREMKRMIDKGK